MTKKFSMQRLPLLPPPKNLKRKVVRSDDPDDLPSGEVYTSDSEEDQPLAFAKSLFLKNKGKKGKCTSTPKSTPKNAPRNAPKSLKDGKKAARKKVKAAAADEPTVCHFWKEPKRGMRRSWSEWQKPRGKAEENNKSFRWML